MKLKKIKSGVVFLALVFSSVALADIYLQSVVEQLRKLDAQAVSEGFEIAGHHVDAMRSGDEITLDVHISQGQTVAFIGVCDLDCADLDLGLVGPNGQVIGVDTYDDDQPIVGIMNAPVSGTYVVHIGMPSCMAQDCIYGLGAYVK